MRFLRAFALRAFAYRFLATKQLPKFYTVRFHFSSSTAAPLHTNDWKNKTLAKKNGQLSSLVREAFKLKKARIVDTSMLQRMDDILSQPRNLAELNQKQYGILLGYYSFCRHRNSNVISMITDHLGNNPAFLGTFDSYSISNSLNSFSKFNIDLRPLFTTIAEQIINRPPLTNQFSSQGIANTLNAFSKRA
jgi:hypothetical protein